MKKNLLSAAFTLLTFLVAEAQCVYTCGTYNVSQITHSLVNAGGVNVVSQFSNNGTYNGDDGSTPAIPIGFNFDFYCNTYSNVYICSNGFIQFDYAPLSWPGPYVHATQNIPNSTIPNGMVAFNMTDLDPGVGGTVTYTTVGTTPNQRFIVTYSNVPCFGQSDLNTGQIILYEGSNIIEVHTSSIAACSNQALGSTQGIENITGTVAVTPPGRNGNAAWTSTASNTAYRFAPYSAPAIGPITGGTVYCQGDVATFNTQQATGALSYSWFPPNSWLGTSGSVTTSSFTVGASGVVSVTANYTCGASPASTLNVTVFQAPVVSITSVTPAIICSGNTVAINVSGASQYTLNPGNITGTNPLTDMPMTSVQYTLIGVDSVGCRSQNTANASILVLESPTVTVNSGSICLGQNFTMTPSGAAQYQFSSTFNQVTPTVTGVFNYSVTGTATNGCVGEVAISSLTVNALPTTSLSANRVVMCAKESITLTATGAANYVWSHTTATSNTLAVSPTLSVTYSVTGTTAEGCSKTSGLFIMVNPCNGLAENSKAGYLLYPNPSTGQFQVEGSVKENISVFDVLGREVHRQAIEAGRNQLGLSHLAPGKYILKGQESGAHHVFVIVQE